MKRIALLLVLFLIAINLSACTTKQEPMTSDISFPQANFNNNYWFFGDFWAFDDTVFYLQDGFYNMGAYCSASGNNKKLFEESDFASNSTKDITIKTADRKVSGFSFRKSYFRISLPAIWHSQPVFAHRLQRYRRYRFSDTDLLPV